MKVLIGYAMLIAAALGSVTSHSEDARWWKGNTHAHSWWSDGDMPPELIASWYKSHGYHFLVLSDHNIMQEGEKWYPIDKPPRRPEQILKAYETYKNTFKDDWIEERVVDGNREVKLKTLDEFRSFYEEKDRFIFIKGEEITDRYKAHPVHMNGVNLVEYIPPQGGHSVVDTIQNNIDAVVAQSKAFNQPMVIHLNHPNFYFAQTAEDFFYLNVDEDDGFFEMYNGHSHVENYGDEHHQSAERMWDIVLAKRVGELRKSLIYGVAVDDAHEYTKWGVGVTNPGRGWIMVKSAYLTPNEITRAIKRGDFYNSTGVNLKSIERDGNSITIEVDGERGVNYTIEFVGTLKNADLSATRATEDHTHFHVTDHEHREVYRYSEDIGKVLKRVDGKKARYEASGEEIYVRVRITSDRAHPNPYQEGDLEMAWTQPFLFQ